MSNLSILVVGASIAGPTTAYWLTKTGAKITVIERFSSLRPGGQAIDIRTSGVSVMRKMPGMEAQVRANLTGEEGLSLLREDGSSYGIIRSSGDPERQSLLSEYEIFRTKLCKILFEMTKDHPNVEYIFGEQIASLQQDEENPGPVRVEFANGTAAAEYDLVVACDGATSRTRAMGFNCGVRDHIFPTSLWAAYFSTKSDLLDGSRIGQGINAPGGRSISMGTDPEGFSRVLIFGTQDKDDPHTPFRTATAQGEPAVKEYIAKRYGNMGWKSGIAIKEMMDSTDFYASETVQVKIPNLYKGRLVLVGDAGYAAGPTGGGTSLALTGAYMLAGEIGKHKGDVEAGLRGYEEQMRPIIKELQKIPPFVSAIMVPQTAWGLWIRNHIWAFVAWSGIVDFCLKYLGTAFASTESVPIPEYDWVA